MPHHRNCLLTTLAVAGLGLLIAVALNYYIDPAGIYRDQTRSASHYASSAVSSENGIWWPEGASDRLLKLELAKLLSRTECIVIGSSHVMTISSNDPQQSLAAQCKSLVNLGVSGGSIEDHITLAYTAVKHTGLQPRKIFLGVDPWLFVFGKSQGWWVYRSEFHNAAGVVLGRSNSPRPDTRNPPVSKLLNLISLDYTRRSIEKLVSDMRGGHEAMVVGSLAPMIDAAIGGTFPVIRPDGSIRYSAALIRNSVSPSIPVGGTVYMTDGELIQPFAVDSYKSFVKWLRAQGHEPILLMTPYHHNVWKAPNAPTTKALLAVEPIVRELGRQLNVVVVGSFDPKGIGCREEEFWDSMHARATCLTRIGQ